MFQVLEPARDVRTHDLDADVLQTATLVSVHVSTYFSGAYQKVVLTS
jgi:hypothetical protein